MFLELNTLVLKNRVSTFCYQCSQYYDQMFRREKVN